MPPEAMYDDPDESFVINTILGQPTCAPVRPHPPGGPALFAAGDDGAAIGDNEVVTVDTMVQGIHFTQDSLPEDVGWKLVAVNASDVSAMACQPSWAVLSISLPSPLDKNWVKGFASGVREALNFWDITLVGGDTTGSPGPIVLSMTMSGVGDRIVGRGGAQPGDTLWVTGVLGEAAEGFTGHTTGKTALNRPQPPVRFGAALGRIEQVTAIMDLSDGLARDLGRLCRMSQVSALVQPDALPRGPSLLDHPDPLPSQVAFGEDYQLLFSANPLAENALRTLAESHQVQLTPIGIIEHKDDHPTARLDGRSWPQPIWSHFDGQIQ